MFSRRRRAEKTLDVVEMGTDGLQWPGRFDNLFEQACFLGLELLDVLFNRSLGDEPVDENRLLLADAVNPVNGLLLGGRVPPRIEKKYVVGCV